MNGNDFLTSFYKLSRFHEKILLGLPLEEDINDVNILLKSNKAGDDGSLSGIFSRSGSTVGGKSKCMRRIRSRNESKSKLPLLSAGQVSQSSNDQRKYSKTEKGKQSAGVGTDILSSFKYSGIFEAESVADFTESRAIRGEDPDFPFELDSPRRGVIKLSRHQLPSPHASRVQSPSGNGHNGMLASMFSGLNPWTASSEELGFIGIASPVKLRSDSPSHSRATSPKKLLR